MEGENPGGGLNLSFFFFADECSIGGDLTVSTNDSC